MDVDKMLAYAGDFGRYQYLLMLLFSVINILSTFDYFGQLFIFVQPEYWCHLPEMTHLQPEERRWIWNPSEDNSCSRYDTNLTTVGVVNGTPDWSGKNRTVRACDAGWEYNLTDGYQSIISEVSSAYPALYRPLTLAVCSRVSAAAVRGRPG